MQPPKINIQESIARQKLIVQENWFDKLDHIMVYFFSVAMVSFSILTLGVVNFSKTNDKAISLTYIPLAIIVALYIFYRKATEKNLVKLATSFSKEKNRELLLTYAQQQQLTILRNNKTGLLILEDDYGSILTHKKWMVFLVTDQYVYFTLLTRRSKLNIPSLISHWTLRSDVKNLFQV